MLNAGAKLSSNITINYLGSKSNGEGVVLAVRSNGTEGSGGNEIKATKKEPELEFRSNL